MHVALVTDTQKSAVIGSGSSPQARPRGGPLRRPGCADCRGGPGRTARGPPYGRSLAQFRPSQTGWLREE